MKHIALRSRSLRNKNQPYTCPGLGDRAHSVLFAYQYSQAHNTPVTLHLTGNKYGKQHKKVSWGELLDLVTDVHIKVWPVNVDNKNILSDDDWMHYLIDNNINAEFYHYEDTFGIHPDEPRTNLDISKYLKKLPCLKPIDHIPRIDLPEKYVTMQWDSTDKSRSISPILLEGVKQKYENQGYSLVTIGGDAKEPLLKHSLAHIGHAIYNARYHVGCDSGMMHLAQFYKNYEDIHIYYNSFQSHHFIRARRNGSKINQGVLS